MTRTRSFDSRATARSLKTAGPQRAAGFSLVELIVVIVITGVIASVVGLFITGPIQGFLDQARRAELVDAAQVAMTRMGRDLRAALPNSVRISGNAIELLLTLDGERYRVETPGTAADRLEFTASDDAFNTLGALGSTDASPAGAYTISGALAIYPVLQAGANPYVAADRSMTPFGNIVVTPVTNSGYQEYRLSLTTAAGAPGAHRFSHDSPTRRVFLVEGPVTYLCSPPQLLRYQGYTMTATQDPTPDDGTASVIAGNVQACAFDYDAGTATRNAVVSVALSLAQGAVQAERVRIIRQIHVDNTP
jgi:MSHA biogenesis protein MshO